MNIHGYFLFMDIVRSVRFLSYLPNLVGWGHQIRKLPDWGTKSIKILNCKLGLDPMTIFGYWLLQYADARSNRVAAFLHALTNFDFPRTGVCHYPVFC